MPYYKFTQSDIEFVYNLLRHSTVKWSGRKEALRRARRRFFVRMSKKGKPIFKWKWRCAKCQRWYRNQEDVEVDHINEIGGVTSFNGDWNEMIFKIMPRPVKDHLQVLCVACHLRKTNAYMAAPKKWKRKERRS